MKKSLLTALFVPIMAGAIAQTTHTVSSSGLSFTPDTVHCLVGDIVQFNLTSTHNAVEVSQSTWLANGTTSNSGFTVGFGGGSTTMTTAGTFYYVCTNHASSGMKGVIIVSTTNSVNDNSVALSVAVFPTRVDDLLQVRITSPIHTHAIVRVYTMLGAEVLNTTLQLAPGESTSRLSLAHLQAGAYFVRVETAGQVRTFKVVR